ESKNRNRNLKIIRRKLQTEKQKRKNWNLPQKREKSAVKFIISVKNKPPVTLATRDLGIWLNLKMVLYLGSLGKSENKA
ncbi:hypothetical protein, partial [Flavobacterium sp. HJJ]|uniref:hypothetical protein n=1 Tax=Flavobacterium sp. HJJ TaxID=2783792 RepID=UPI001E2A743B